MDFGTRLRDARNDAGLTGEKLGELLGVSKQTIAHWEANRYEPKLIYLARLCDVLDVSADWLLTGKSVEHLSPAAVKQGRFYDSLTLEGRRKWETAKLLIREAVPDSTVEQRMPITAAPPMNMGVVPDARVRKTDTLVSQSVDLDTVAHTKHLQLSIPGTNKTEGAKNDERGSNTGDGSPRGGKHVASPTPSGRSRKT